MEVRKNKLKPKPVIARPFNLGRGNLRKQLLTLLVIASLLIPAIPATASEPTQAQIKEGISKAVNYLRSQQAKDGGINSAMGKPATSAWAAMAFASAGINPQTIKKIKGIPAKKQRSVMHYLKAYTLATLKNPDETISANDYARQILAANTIEPYPHAFGGVNLLKHLAGYYDSQTQQFGNASWLNDDVFAIIAYTAASPIAAESYKYANSVDFLINSQNQDDGGFGWIVGTSDIDMTAASLQALILAKEAKERAGVETEGLDDAINNAYGYLKNKQNSDGGFPGWSGDSDVSSTAWAVQAIVAYNSTSGLEEFDKGDGNDPISYLLSQQLSDGGFGYGGNSDSYTTSQVIPALAKAPWPIRWNTNSRLLSTKIGIRGSRRIVGVGKYLTISGTLSPPRSGYVYLRYKRGRSKWRTLRRIKVNGPNFKTKVKISKASRYVFAAKYGADTSKKIVVYGRRRR